jgi:hypothetical protein
MREMTIRDSAAQFAKHAQHHLRHLLLACRRVIWCVRARSACVAWHCSSSSSAQHRQCQHQHNQQRPERISSRSSMNSSSSSSTSSSSSSGNNTVCHDDATRYSTTGIATNSNDNNNNDDDNDNNTRLSIVAVLDETLDSARWCVRPRAFDFYRTLRAPRCGTRQYWHDDDGSVRPECI